MTFTEQWARAFALTTAVELLVAVPLLRPADGALVRRVQAIVLANLATHPAVWFVLPQLGLAHEPTVALSEGWAVGLELLVYRLVFPKLRWTGALAVSALANGASFAVGLVVRAATGWV